MNPKLTQELRELLCGHIKSALTSLMRNVEDLNVTCNTRIVDGDSIITHQFEVKYLGRKFYNFTILEHSRDDEDDFKLRLSAFQEQFSYHMELLLMNLREHEIAYKSDQIIFKCPVLKRLLGANE